MIEATVYDVYYVTHANQGQGGTVAEPKARDQKRYCRFDSQPAKQLVFHCALNHENDRYRRLGAAC